MYFAEGLWNTKSLERHDGYCYTLTSRISDMLTQAEVLFGERDKTWTILGCEINYDDGATPQNWYPGGTDRKHIIFQLVPPADTNLNIALFQLSHEVIHALSPEIGTSANVLEEGVATWFSHLYTKGSVAISIESYVRAERLVVKLLETDEFAIRKLRKIEPCFKHMTEDTFRRAEIAVDGELVRELLAPFIR